MKCNNASGPTSIPTHILKLLKHEISYPLSILINLSFSSGSYPIKLKTAQVIPIFKQERLRLELLRFCVIFYCVIFLDFALPLPSKKVLMSTKLYSHQKKQLKIFSLSKLGKIYVKCVTRTWVNYTIFLYKSNSAMPAFLF